MLLVENENITQLSEPINFEVIALSNTTMPAENRKAKVDFQRKVDALQAKMGEYNAKLSQIKDKIPYIEEALRRSNKPVDLFYSSIKDIKFHIEDSLILNEFLFGTFCNIFNFIALISLVLIDVTVNVFRSFRTCLSISDGSRLLSM